VISLSVSTSSVDNAIPKYDGVDGLTLQASTVIIDDSDNVSAIGTLDISGLATFLAGLALTGNITVTGTVDTRDIATDGTKLDGIEASADVNAVIPTMLEGAETSVGQAALASAGTVVVFTVDGSETWKVREIYLSGDGTNFSGGGGDRDLDILEGSTVWTTIPAATLQSLAVARWGDTGVPFPATAAHFTTATGAGGDIVAAYSGGTTDYTAGALTIVIIAERTA
jgi:hypothetical protein